MAFETRLTPAMSARWRGAGLWSDETFATVLARRVRETPDREALTDGTHRLSYRELADGIDRMAARLRALGIGAGDVVTIQLPNWVEFALVFFALERLAAVAVTVSVDFRSRELEYIMRFADSKMLVCCGRFRDFDHAAMAAELTPRLPALAAIGIVRGDAARRHDEPRRRGRGARRAGGLRARADGCRHGDADGVHVGDDRQPQGRDAQPQHHARRRPHPQRRCRACGRRRHDDLAAARFELGLSHARAVGRRRRQGGPARPLRAGGGARPHRARARHLHPHRAGVADRHPAAARPRSPRPLQPAHRGERRRLGAGRDHPRVAAGRARRAARASGHAGNRIPGLHAPDRRSRTRRRLGRRAREPYGVAAGRRRRPRRRARRGGRHLLRRAFRASRLSQQSGRQRGSVPARRLVSQRRSRHDRSGRTPAHRRAPEGDDQPRRQEVLPARDRGDSLYPPAGALRRDRRHSRCAPGRAQLPVPGAASWRGADARGFRRLSR